MEIAPRWSRRWELLRRLAGKPAADPLMRQWYAWASRRRDVFFVQIGSNDGLRGDPLAYFIDKHTGWRGILVEPIPETFTQLAASRGEDRFQLVQAAVTDHDGMATMRVVESSDVWASQLASLCPEVAESHRGKLHDFGVHDLEVPAVTFATLTANVDRLDVLHLDTEGHDGAILAQVDFDRWTLPVVLYEHRHLSSEVRADCEARMRSHRYRLWSNSMDTLAVRP